MRFDIRIIFCIFIIDIIKNKLKKEKMIKKELNVLVLNPFTNETINESTLIKEGNLNMLSLPMREVYHINEDPDGKHGINPLIGENFESIIIIDLQKLNQHLDRVETIDRMLFVIGAEKSLKKMSISFLGNEEAIRTHFDIYNETVTFFEKLSEAAIALN